MSDRVKKKPVLVIPCSGIGKVHGLLSREATYLLIDETAPEKTATMCLGQLVKGDSEALEAVKSQACIAIDGCSKATVCSRSLRCASQADKDAVAVVAEKIAAEIDILLTGIEPAKISWRRRTE